MTAPAGALLEGACLEVQFDRLGPKGDAMALTAAQPLYAAGVIPGERALVRIRKVKRNWIAVDVEAIREPSPDRVAPPCPLFEQCSGCQLQHIAYPRQLELKRELVREQLRAFGGFEAAPVEPVIGAAAPWNYRNHARFTVHAGTPGFVRRFRRQWFEVPTCMIMDPRINAVVREVSGRLGNATQCNVRVGGDPGELMIQPALAIEGTSLPTGQPHLFETLHGHRFRVSAASFFQVNRAQAERMIDVVRAFVGRDPQATVVDAYAGVGTFAVLLAPQVGKVIAIEESGPAVADARVNIEGFANIELRLGKSELLLGEIEGPIAAVILDPPRSGCRPSAIEALRRTPPERIVYVSCEPMSLARDLAALTADGLFRLEAVQPVDMFPHTHHVECIALLRHASGEPVR